MNELMIKFKLMPQYYESANTQNFKTSLLNKIISLNNNLISKYKIKLDVKVKKESIEILVKLQGESQKVEV